MSEKFIYLAGPITGMSYDQAIGGWRAEFAALWNDVTSDYNLLSPMRGKDHLRHVKKFVHAPLEMDTPLTSARGTMARDFHDIRRSTLIVAGMHEPVRQPSVGTCIELGYAKALGKPIVMIGNDVGPHSHMWLKELPDFRVGSVEEAVEVAENFLSEYGGYSTAKHEVGGASGPSWPSTPNLTDWQAEQNKANIKADVEAMAKMLAEETCAKNWQADPSIVNAKKEKHK